MRKIIIDVDTLRVTPTGNVTIKEVAKAGIATTLSAIASQVERDGWESGEDALVAVCAEMWHAFREERERQKTK